MKANMRFMRRISKAILDQFECYIEKKTQHSYMISMTEQNQVWIQPFS